MNTMTARLRNAFNAVIEGRSREVARRVATYTAAFSADDMWADLKSGRDAKRSSGLPHAMMRVGG